MRAGLVLIAALLLGVAPAAAQGKTKTPPGVQVLELCELFASGDVLAVETALDQGWDAYEAESESPYVRTYDAFKDINGLGYADLYVLVESYSDRTFGYCRVDFNETVGDAASQVEAIVGLDRYDAETTNNDEGSYASLIGTYGNQDRLLLTHATDSTFVIQLSVTIPEAAASQ